MKKIYISLIIIISLILFGKDSFAIDKSSINLEENPNTHNSEKNINHAQLIEQEVVKFKTKLLEIEKNYNIVWDQTIALHIKDIDEIIYILRKIQTTKVNKATAENVISIVINDLKNINIQAKQYLRDIQEIDNKKISDYSKIANSLEKNIDRIIWQLSKYYTAKENLTDNDKQVIRKLEELKNITLDLNRIQKFPSKYSSQQKNELIKIIQNIQSILREMKQI